MILHDLLLTSGTFVTHLSCDNELSIFLTQGLDAYVDIDIAALSCSLSD